MAYQIFRVAKVKRQGVGGCQQEHNRTEKDVGRFPDSEIDYTKTKDNVYLKKSKDYWTDIKNTLERYGIKNWRKDAVVMNDAIYTASPEAMESMTKDEAMQYFVDCVNWHQEHFGPVINAVIHKDETTWHMHVDSVPLVQKEDGTWKLSAKDQHGNRGKLASLQTDLYEKVSKYYNLERGESRNPDEKRTHKTKLEHDIEKLDKEIEQKEKQVTIAKEKAIQKAKEEIASIKEKEKVKAKEEIAKEVEKAKTESMESLKEASERNQEAEEMMNQTARLLEKIPELEYKYQKAKEKHEKDMEKLEQEKSEKENEIESINTEIKAKREEISKLSGEAKAQELARAEKLKSHRKSPFHKDMYLVHEDEILAYDNLGNDQRLVNEEKKKNKELKKYLTQEIKKYEQKQQSSSNYSRMCRQMEEKERELDNIIEQRVNERIKDFKSNVVQILEKMGIKKQFMNLFNEMRRREKEYETDDYERER